MAAARDQRQHGGLTSLRFTVQGFYACPILKMAARGIHQSSQYGPLGARLVLKWLLVPFPTQHPLPPTQSGS